MTISTIHGYHNSTQDATLVYFILSAIFFFIHLISSILLSVGASKGSYMILYFIFCKMNMKITWFSKMIENFVYLIFRKSLLAYSVDDHESARYWLALRFHRLGVCLALLVYFSNGPAYLFVVFHSIDNLLRDCSFVIVQ